jgi:hypothetical protein
MMTQQLEVSILAAPLAAIDPRALSQAWYSALGLVPRTPDARRAAGRMQTPACARVRAGSREETKVMSRATGESRALLGIRLKKSEPRALEDECRSTLRRQVLDALPLAVRIARAFSDPRWRPKRATFSMGRGNARVHVILQTKGDSTTLVAVCRPELRAIVGRALTDARIALAARGIGVEVLAQEGSTCTSIRV